MLAYRIAHGTERVPANLSAENLWLLPSDINLSGAEIELSTRLGREQRLREALEPVFDEFDHIIIDTPPSLGLLSINALSAAELGLDSGSGRILRLGRLSRCS